MPPGTVYLLVGCSGPANEHGEPLAEYPDAVGIPLDARETAKLIGLMEATRDIDAIGDLEAVVFKNTASLGLASPAYYSTEWGGPSIEEYLHEYELWEAPLLVDADIANTLPSPDRPPSRLHVTPDVIWWTAPTPEAGLRAYTHEVGLSDLREALLWALPDDELAAFVRTLPSIDPELYIRLLESDVYLLKTDGMVPFTRPVPEASPDELAPLLQHSSQEVRQWAILRLGTGELEPVEPRRHRGTP